MSSKGSLPVRIPAEPSDFSWAAAAVMFCAGWSCFRTFCHTYKSFPPSLLLHLAAAPEGRDHPSRGGAPGTIPGHGQGPAEPGGLRGRNGSPLPSPPPPVPGAEPVPQPLPRWGGGT